MFDYCVQKSIICDETKQRTKKLHNSKYVADIEKSPSVNFCEKISIWHWHDQNYSIRIRNHLCNCSSKFIVQYRIIIKLIFYQNLFQWSIKYEFSLLINYIITYWCILNLIHSPILK